MSINIISSLAKSLKINPFLEYSMPFLLYQCLNLFVLQMFHGSVPLLIRRSIFACEGCGRRGGLTAESGIDLPRSVAIYMRKLVTKSMKKREMKVGNLYRDHNDMYWTLHSLNLMGKRGDLDLDNIGIGECTCFKI